MKNIIKNKYIGIFIGWILVLVLAIATMPNISNVVSEKGEITLPSDLQSQIANKIGEEYSGQNSSQIIAVFNKDGELTDTDKENIKETLNNLNDKKEDYSINEITSSATSEEAAKQLRSEDKTTELALISVNKEKVETVAGKINEQIKTKDLNTYITGGDVLQKEFGHETQTGIQKTEIISIIFILGVLIIIFRSPIAPLLSLVTVGTSLIVSLNIIMNLANHYNFPLSNFTQVFLVVVLLGIGTDYNILLYNKFKEELEKGHDKFHAAKIAIKTAGKTILFSGSSVFIGFAVLILAEFIIYRSAFGVAIGVAVLLLNLLTLNLFFMSVLGEKMFWPSKGAKGHGESKLWSKLSQISLMRPLIMIGLSLIIAVPFVGHSMTRTLNYNDADELPDTNFAKQGYTIIQNHYSKGMSAPVNIYIKSDKELDNSESLSDINKITTFLKEKDEISSVLSVTEPTGEKIEDLYLKKQLETLTTEINTAQDGVKNINSGLSGAKSQLDSQNISSNLSQVGQLSDGAKQVSDATSAFGAGLNTYVNGVDSFSLQVSEAANSPKLAQATSQMQQLSKLSSDLDSLGIKGEQINSDLANLSSLIQSLNAQVNDPNLTDASVKLEKLNAALSSLETLKENSKNLQNEVSSLVAMTSEVNSATTELKQGGNSLLSSIEQLEQGSKEVSDATAVLNSELQKVGSQVGSLSNGLGEASSGLSQIDTGITDANKYLTELKDSNIGREMYIPKSVIESGQLNASFDNYLSKDKKITKMTVVLKDSPTTLESANFINNLEKELETVKATTSLKDSQVVIGGQTSQVNDLSQMASKDFTKSGAIMLVGIALVLIVITGSLTQSFTIVTTLGATYFASLTIAEQLSKWILGKELLGWNAPFFIFIMLIALGVDYSIFLAMRYKENIELANMKPTIAIKNASGIIGGVVISAAIILGGTFAALYPSGITTLIHVAFGVIAGLILLVIFLPITMSATIKLSHKK